jgi:hypothetical protein
MIYNFTGKAKEEHKSPKLVDMMQRLSNGEKLKSSEMCKAALPFLTLTALRDGVYRLMGWAYDFRPYMHKYVVKTQYYLEECYALNKTEARESFKGLGKVIYIVEVSNPFRQEVKSNGTI